MSNDVNRELLTGALVPKFVTNSKGERESQWKKNQITGNWHRVLESVTPQGQRFETYSALPEDSWKSLEQAVIGEQSVPMSAVTDLQAAGLTIPESPFFVQHEWDVTSEVTAANITVDGEESDNQDQFQTERKSITIPVISK